jgi:hypothetical protein
VKAAAAAALPPERWAMQPPFRWLLWAAVGALLGLSLQTSTGAEAQGQQEQEQQRSMLQVVRVPDPLASAEAGGADWLATLRSDTLGAGQPQRLGPQATAALLVPVPPTSVKGSRFRGRGIAVAVNGADPVMLASAFALVRVVRKVFKSPLPIELFHLGPSERFSAAATARFAAEGGVRILDLHEVAKQVRKTPFWSHFYIKTILLPRQAREKHRKNSKKHRFSCRATASGTTTADCVTRACLARRANHRHQGLPAARSRRHRLQTRQNPRSTSLRGRSVGGT